MTNRLAQETSPYLLQHAHNPVDWYPWGEEALTRARRERRPILLSIGYSACHWCHVMERESFEDEATAALMNEHFVSIKVDREERPDIDNIYMTAVQGLTGQGGWPLTAFLTPEGVPFFGGTYFPPEDRQGMPSLRRVMLAVLDAFQNRPDDVLKSAGQVQDYLKRRAAMQGLPGMLTPALLDKAAEGMTEGFDAAWGGFGRAPKFPMPMGLDYLLRSAARKKDAALLNVVTTTLDHMAQGGMYDHVGGGFHRYSTDARWLVPHFEKMLYDNAQLARLYLAAYQYTGNPFYRRTTEETLDYVVREMTNAEGGFFSTQDADSEGEEGKFYVWTPPEIDAVLGPRDALLVGRYFDVTAGGNFEGKNILWTPQSADDVAASLGIATTELMAAVNDARGKLYAAREQRIHPGLDDKVLTSWNGMMLRAFAEAAAVLERPDYEAVAVRNAEFLLRELVKRGRVLRTYKDGRAHLNGYLEDYANLADGLIALYEATFDRRWLDEARSLTDTMLDRFWDDAVSGFYDTSSDHETLVTRPRDIFDNATPSGNAVAVDVLLRLAEHTGARGYRDRAETALRGMSSLLIEHASGFGRWLAALDFALATVKEVAIVGEPDAADTRELLRAVRRPYLPNKVVAATRPGAAATTADLPLLADRPQLDGRATAYVCQNYTCNLPVTDAAALTAQLA